MAGAESKNDRRNSGGTLRQKETKTDRIIDIMDLRKRKERKRERKERKRVKKREKERREKKREERKRER